MEETLEQKYLRIVSERDARRERYRKEMEANERDKRHGTSKGYFYGCRCDRCKAAIAKYRKERKC